MAAIFAHSQARGTELAVLLAIAHHAKPETDGRWSAYPGVRRLAQATNVSERSVKAAVTGLARTGELVRLINAGGSSEDLRADQRPNLYLIADLCKRAQCDRTRAHRTPRATGAPTSLSDESARGEHSRSSPSTRGTEHAATVRAELARQRAAARPSTD